MRGHQGYNKFLQEEQNQQGSDKLSKLSKGAKENEKDSWKGA